MDNFLTRFAVVVDAANLTKFVFKDQYKKAVKIMNNIKIYICNKVKFYKIYLSVRSLL